MNSTQYDQLVNHSFKTQFAHAMEDRLLSVGGISIIETSLDLGRQSGKTKFAAEKIIRDSNRGIFTYYVAHNQDAAIGFAKQNLSKDLVKCIVMGKKADFSNLCRGTTQYSQAINLIFDECDLTYNERMEYVRMIAFSIKDVLHPFRYIHVIRLGM